MKKPLATLVVGLGLATAPRALAQSQGTNATAVVPPHAPERQQSLNPEKAEAAPHGRATLQSDPIADGCIIVVSLGSAGVLELINSTGEIRPQQIAPNFNPNKLVWLDRGAVKSKYSSSAGSLSNMGLGVAGLFAVVDPVLSGFREHSVQTAIVDAIMYAETASLTLALTNVVKMAVRRPRPIAYAAAKDNPDYASTSTDSSLSFFSGHASMTGAIGATATYLAFTRSPNSWRPWVTLAAAVGVTTFTSFERVQAGKHFPTDVIAGAFAGAGIGVVVPHLHRTEDVQQRRVWVGFNSTPRSEQGDVTGGVLTLSGAF